MGERVGRDRESGRWTNGVSERDRGASKIHLQESFDLISMAAPGGRCPDEMSQLSRL